MTITKDMLIADVLQKNEDLADVFFEFGMHCLGCPISHGENIEQAAAAHGIDLDSMLSELNKRAEKKS
ncbi:disulfide oxidoreductase [Clostridia bacterium]|nr:disulfide oxidoreductase [Clostridia bacterium]